VTVGGGWIAHVLGWFAHQPFVLLFVVIAAGYAAGQLKVKGVGLGTTAAALVIALAVSLIGTAAGVKIEVPAIASTIFFNLFMFSVGMKVGPQFLSGLRRDAGKFIFFGLFIPVFSGSRAAPPPARASARRRRRTRRRAAAKRSATCRPRSRSRTASAWSRSSS